MTIIEKLFSLTSKIALVTGASNGNGAAIARGLHEAGAAVINLDIVPPSYTNHSIEYICCDITDLQSLHKTLNDVVRKYKKIDILVNNAGVSFPASFLDYPQKLWDTTYEVNLKAPFELMKRVAIIMKNNAGGSIINITSLNSELAFPDNPAYVAFKGALKQLSKSAALDLGKYKIRVNNVGPGYFMTNMTKASWQNAQKREQRNKKTILNRWGRPEDLIGTIIFLSSDASSYITGQDIYVDGGWLIKGL